MILRVLNIIAILFVFSQASAQDLVPDVPPVTNEVYKSLKDAIIAQANGIEVVHLDLKREKLLNKNSNDLFKKPIYLEGKKNEIELECSLRCVLNVSFEYSLGCSLIMVA